MSRALFLLLIFASSASAQVVPTLGSRVRTVPASDTEPRRAGKVMSLSTDSVTVRFETVSGWNLRVDTLNVPTSRLEILTATRRRTALGAFIGGTALAVTGLIAGSNVGSLCEGSPAAGFQCRKDDSAQVPLFIAGGIVGAGVGAIIGHLTKSETWEPFSGRATSVDGDSRPANRAGEREAAELEVHEAAVAGGMKKR
jgi:hypothetical protein